MDKKETKLITNVIILGIAFTIIFIMLTSYYAIQINNNKFCGKNAYGDYSFSTLSNSSYALNGNTNYILQKININDRDNVKFDFCYNVKYNGSNTVTVDIIDNYNTIYGTEYIFNDTELYCTEFNSAEISKNIYLGIRCNDCTTSNVINIQKESLGIDTKQIRSDGVGVFVEENDTLSYKLYGYGNCKTSLMVFFKWYLFLLFALFFVIILLVGWNKFKDILFKNDI